MRAPLCWLRCLAARPPPWGFSFFVCAGPSGMVRLLKVGDIGSADVFACGGSSCSVRTRRRCSPGGRHPLRTWSTGVRQCSGAEQDLVDHQATSAGRSSSTGRLLTACCHEGSSYGGSRSDVNLTTDRGHHTVPVAAGKTGRRVLAVPAGHSAPVCRGPTPPGKAGTGSFCRSGTPSGQFARRRRQAPLWMPRRAALRCFALTGRRRDSRFWRKPSAISHLSEDFLYATVAHRTTEAT